MNKNIRKSLLQITAFAIVPFFLASCQKDNNTSGKTPSEILTSHKWRYFRVGDTNNDISISWDAPVSDACEKDNFWEFKANGNLLVDEGPKKCSPSDPQTLFNGSWQLASNNTIIKLNNGLNPDLKVVNLTENSLIVIELDGGYPHECYDLIPY